MFKSLQIAALVGMAALFAAGCGNDATSDDATPPSSDASTTAPSTTTPPTTVPPTTAPSTTAAPATTAPTTAAPSLAPVAPDEPSLHGVRYCELLTVAPGADGVPAAAEVWNTMGLNDCPADAWDAVDLDNVTALTGAAIATANGPRHWVLDSIGAGEMSGSLEVIDFGGLELRSVAVVQLPETAGAAGAAGLQAYTEVSVERDTLFTFRAGRQVYELTAPDGSIYIMQSYTLQLDPDQTVDSLASLGERLDLPDGWTFSTRVLTEDLQVEDLEGIATVVGDGLRNAYQLRTRG